MHERLDGLLRGLGGSGDAHHLGPDSRDTGGDHEDEDGRYHVRHHVHLRHDHPLGFQRVGKRPAEIVCVRRGPEVHGAVAFRPELRRVGERAEGHPCHRDVGTGAVGRWDGPGVPAARPDGVLPVYGRLQVDDARYAAPADAVAAAVVDEPRPTGV